MKPPKLVVIGEGSNRLSMISLDLSGEEEALAIARRLAEQTGRAVSVGNAAGEIVRVINRPVEN